MVSREIWEKHALMSFSEIHKLHSSFVLLKLTPACFSQIALETTLLPILIIYREIIFLSFTVDFESLFKVPFPSLF